MRSGFKSESHSAMSPFATPWTMPYSPWDSPGQNTGVGSLYLLQNLPNPGIKPRSPALEVDSLPTEPPGKPKNTGVGRLSLFQWIFLTQELNRDLLLCRRILYQLSHQGSPVWGESNFIPSVSVCPGWAVLSFSICCADADEDAYTKLPCWVLLT